MKSTFKNGIFAFELDGYAVELYKDGDLWLDKIYTLFGHVVNRISSEKSIKFSEVVDAIKEDIREARQIETTIFKNVKKYGITKFFAAGKHKRSVSQHPKHNDG